MKTTKRVLSMVLALMMFFSLSVTAFADTVVKAPDIKVNVVTSRSGKTPSWTVAANVGQTVKDAIDSDLYVTSHMPDWKKVADYYEPTTIRYALNGYGDFTSTKFDKSNSADVANLIDKSDYDEVLAGSLIEGG